MNTQLIYGTNIITLPPDLDWKDEYKYSKVHQNQEYAISGALIVDEWIKLAMPIILSGAEDRSWIDKVTLDALQVFVNLPMQSATLILSDGRSFNVIADNSNGSALKSHSIFQTFPEREIFIIDELKFISSNGG